MNYKTKQHTKQQAIISRRPCMGCWQACIFCMLYVSQTLIKDLQLTSGQKQETKGEKSVSAAAVKWACVNAMLSVGVLCSNLELPLVQATAYLCAGQEVHGCASTCVWWFSNLMLLCNFTQLQRKAGHSVPAEEQNQSSSGLSQTVCSFSCTLSPPTCQPCRFFMKSIWAAAWGSEPRLSGPGRKCHCKHFQTNPNWGSQWFM